MQKQNLSTQQLAVLQGRAQWQFQIGQQPQHITRQPPQNYALFQVTTEDLQFKAAVPVEPLWWFLAGGLAGAGIYCIVKNSR